MLYHVHINYFNSDSGEMTLLSECNIQDLDDLKERVVKPYVFGHSFKFCGLDLILASIHKFSVYESEVAVEGSLELGISGMREISREVMG